MQDLVVVMQSESRKCDWGAETDADTSYDFIYTSGAAHGLNAVSGVRVLRYTSGAHCIPVLWPRGFGAGRVLQANAESVRIAMAEFALIFCGNSVARENVASLESAHGSDMRRSKRRSWSIHSANPAPENSPLRCSSPYLIDLASSPRQLAHSHRVP